MWQPPYMRLVTPQTTEPVSLVEARAQVRRDDTDDDLALGLHIAGARGFAEMFTGRLWCDAEYEMRFLHFGRACYWSAYEHIPIWSPYWITGADIFADGDTILLPMANIGTVSNFTYVDSAGATQTYTGYVFDDNPDRPCIRRPQGGNWPADARDIRLKFKGLAPAVSMAQWPAVKAAILLLTGQFYENREEGTIASGAALVMPIGVKTLLHGARVNLGA